MKRLISKSLALTGVIIMLGCAIDCPPYSRPDISSVEAVLDGAVADVAELRLGLSFGIKYVTQRVYNFPGIQAAYACSVAPPSGLVNKITLLSLTCDKTIRGFEPGQNLLTTSSIVKTAGNPGDETATLNEWLTIINTGRIGSRYDLPEVYDIYNVEISFIPEGTEVAAGEYTFELTVEWQNSPAFKKTFAPIRID